MADLLDVLNDPLQDPLCVDLDETLIMIDSFYQAIERLVFSKPWLVPQLIQHWLKSRACVKAWLAGVIETDPQTLPYRMALVDYLHVQKALGRKIYLVSASNQKVVDKVAAYLKLFDGAYGSSESFNAKGANKVKVIKEHIGPRFVYAGDCTADLAVWRDATAAILCGKAAGFAAQMSIPIEKIFPETDASL